MKTHKKTVTMEWWQMAPGCVVHLCFPLDPLKLGLNARSGVGIWLVGQQREWAWGQRQKKGDKQQRLTYIWKVFQLSESKQKLVKLCIAFIKKFYRMDLLNDRQEIKILLQANDPSESLTSSFDLKIVFSPSPTLPIPRTWHLSPSLSDARRNLARAYVSAIGHSPHQLPLLVLIKQQL